MFDQSSQQLSFEQQTIALSHNYPCPRCRSGALSPFGHTETFKCSHCTRSFVPLYGARLLFPSQATGLKVSSTYWWDGTHWHLAGTTASANQLGLIFAAAIVPMAIVHLTLLTHLWETRPVWCSPLLLSIVVGLITLQVLYFTCWDFSFPSKKKGHR